MCGCVKNTKIAQPTNLSGQLSERSGWLTREILTKTNFYSIGIGGDEVSKSLCTCVYTLRGEINRRHMKKEIYSPLNTPGTAQVKRTSPQAGTDETREAT